MDETLTDKQKYVALSENKLSLAQPIKYSVGLCILTQYLCVTEGNNNNNNNNNNNKHARKQGYNWTKITGMNMCQNYYS